MCLWSALTLFHIRNFPSVWAPCIALILFLGRLKGSASIHEEAEHLTHEYSPRINSKTENIILFLVPLSQVFEVSLEGAFCFRRYFLSCLFVKSYFASARRLLEVTWEKTSKSWLINFIGNWLWERGGKMWYCKHAKRKLELGILQFRKANNQCHTEVENSFWDLLKHFFLFCFFLRYVFFVIQFLWTVPYSLLILINMVINFIIVNKEEKGKVQKERDGS